MTLLDVALGVAFYYPLFMAWTWITGGIYYYFHWERDDPPVDAPPDLPSCPGASLVVPCHNEGANVRETLAWLLAQDYPDFEVIAVNDGSRDETGAILDEVAAREERLRVIHLVENQGKAMGLRYAALAARYEFLICIDGDTLLDPHATRWMMRHFLNGPRVGAVTGNPRIRTRSTLLGRIQVGEFSSIIGLIKRTQRIYGQVFTVSGVVAAFRKSALLRVGFWSVDMVTEDIDISWKLQADHWAIRFEPNALCWILMPETIRGLWRQRLRWAQGGCEVLLKYWRTLLRWRRRRMWPVFVEYVSSVLWAYVMAGLILGWAVGLVLPFGLELPAPFPGWHGVVLGSTCLLQFFVSMRIDGRYEQGLARYYYWIIWYPLVYWTLNMMTTVVAVPKVLFRPRGRRATWVSPDRGYQDGTLDEMPT